MTRRIQPLNLLPLSWGKTICVGPGSAPKIIEGIHFRRSAVMDQSKCIIYRPFVKGKTLESKAHTYFLV